MNVEMLLYFNPKGTTPNERFKVYPAIPHADERVVERKGWTFLTRETVLQNDPSKLYDRAAEEHPEYAEELRGLAERTRQNVAALPAGQRPA